MVEEVSTGRVVWRLGEEKINSKDKYPYVDKIVYGRGYDVFDACFGPLPLKKETVYEVAIKMRDGKFAGEVFIIRKNNKAEIVKSGI